MFYKKYQLYDDKLEIMLPANLNETKGFFTTQHTWVSDDKKIVVNISKNGTELDKSQILFRMDDYYKGFERDILQFECIKIKKTEINFQPYGEMAYFSDMMGYQFYNIFLLGCFENKEIVVTLQCMSKDIKNMEHVFGNIIDSLRIKNSGIKENEL